MTATSFDTVPNGVALHPDCLGLACLVGTWKGEGVGDYPMIDDSRYIDGIRFAHVGKPFLSMSQRPRDVSSGLPLHAESGYLTALDNGSMELVVAQPSGMSEVDVAVISTSHEGAEIDQRSIRVVTTPSAREVTELRRLPTATGDEMPD